MLAAALLAAALAAAACCCSTFATVLGSTQIELQTGFIMKLRRPLTKNRDSDYENHISVLVVK